MNSTKTFFIGFAFAIFVAYIAINCTRNSDDTIKTKQLTAQGLPPVQMSPIPCDSLKNVAFGDTLKVVPNTIFLGPIKKGKYKGKTYWQALLSSDNLIPPTNFRNDPTYQRIIIADTLAITNASIFIVARIK